MAENPVSIDADCYLAVERAKEIVRADEWHGDLRVNMTRVVGAGRVLAKEVEKLSEYAETLENLRWYLGARGVNEEEAAMASQKVLKSFEAAELRVKKSR
jgi:hypothetical protein